MYINKKRRKNKIKQKLTKYTQRYAKKIIFFLARARSARVFTLRVNTNKSL